VILEMTGAFSLLLPTLVACAAAYVVPTAIGDAPIYDALRTRPRDAPLSFRGAHGP
jgi:H+/Cl- antiporter ClcA